jgi:hypothetical protein
MNYVTKSSTLQSQCEWNTAVISKSFWTEAPLFNETNVHLRSGDKQYTGIGINLGLVCELYRIILQMLQTDFQELQKFIYNFFNYNIVARRPVARQRMRNKTVVAR